MGREFRIYVGMCNPHCFIVIYVWQDNIETGLQITVREQKRRKTKYNNTWKLSKNLWRMLASD